MKQLNLKSLALSVAIVGCGVMSTYAAPQSSPDGSNKNLFSGEFRQREFRGKKPFTVNDKKLELKHLKSEGMQKAMVDDAAMTFENIPNYDYLLAPDGSTWYYIAEYESTFIEHNEYWTEEVLGGFTFTIFDSAFNEVGKIHDKITVAPNETRCVEVFPDQALSARFFNTDDKMEIMVFHAMNTPEYINHYYYKVYSIGGEKDEEGNDKCIGVYEGGCVDATNVGGTGDSENFYFTFVIDPADRQPTLKGQEKVDYINSLTYDLTTYKKATADSEPTILLEKQIYGTRRSGDTTDGMYLVTKPHNGSLYMAFNQYEKPYLIEPVIVNGDERATPNNSFIIETYKVTDDKADLITTTTIPVEDLDVSEKLYYVFYSIGSVGWSTDIDVTHHGKTDAPAFIVNHTIEEVAAEAGATSYEIYSNDGKLVRTIADGTENMILFNDGLGEEPHAMFIKQDQYGDYQFEFRGLYSGDPVAAISQRNGGDPLSAQVARVPYGDTYKYAFELINYAFDPDLDETYIRVAWFNADGSKDRIDDINMGHNVQYAMVNMDPAGLKPNIYDDDEGMEYAVLVKRSYGSSARNEFIVVDDNQGLYGDFTADDGRGEPYMFTVLPGETNRIMMVYAGLANNRFNVDLYDLPFLNPSVSGVDQIVDNEASPLRYDGSSVYAQDCTIEIYNMSGVKAAQGKDSVSVADFANGVYVVMATDAQGKKHTAKIQR